MTVEKLIDLLKSAEHAEEIDSHRDVIVRRIPSVEIMFDFDQKNHAHHYAVLNHQFVV